jgi:hypothetical protein
VVDQVGLVDLRQLAAVPEAPDRPVRVEQRQRVVAAVGLSARLEDEPARRDLRLDQPDQDGEREAVDDARVRAKGSGALALAQAHAGRGGRVVGGLVLDRAGRGRDDVLGLGEDRARQRSELSRQRKRPQLGPRDVGSLEHDLLGAARAPRLEREALLRDRDRRQGQPERSARVDQGARVRPLDGVLGRLGRVVLGLERDELDVRRGCAVGLEQLALERGRQDFRDRREVALEVAGDDVDRLVDLGEVLLVLRDDLAQRVATHADRRGLRWRLISGGRELQLLVAIAVVHDDFDAAVTACLAS